MQSVNRGLHQVDWGLENNSKISYSREFHSPKRDIHKPEIPTSHLHQTIINTHSTGGGEVNHHINVTLLVAEDVHGQRLIPAFSLKPWQEEEVIYRGEENICIRETKIRSSQQQLDEKEM